MIKHLLASGSQPHNSFTFNELSSVLETISSSMIKPEAALTRAILLNTHKKELFTALGFVSAFVEAMQRLRVKR